MTSPRLLKNAFLVAAAALFSDALVPAARGAVLYKDSSTDPLSALTSWWTTEAGTTDPTAIGNTDTLWFGGIGQAASLTTLTLGADLTVGALRLDNITGTPNYNVTIATGNTLILKGNNDYNAGYLSGIVMNSGTGGTLTINSSVAIAASQRFVTSRALTIGGALDLRGNTLTLHVATAGSAGMTKITGVISSSTAGGKLLIENGSNTAWIYLTGANTFDGGTTLTAGNLWLGNASALGTGTLTFNGSAASQASLSSYDATTYSIANNIAFGANSFADIGLTGYGALTLTGAMNLGASTRTITTTGTATFSGVVTGSGGLSLAGAGTRTFSGLASTFTGQVSLAGGTTNVAKFANTGVASSLGTGAGGASSLILNGAALTYNGTSADTTDRAIDIRAASTTITNSSQGGSVNFTAASLIQGGTLANRTLTLNGAGLGNSIFGSVIGNPTGFTTSFTKDGTGVWTLSGLNTYTGVTTIKGNNATSGELRVTSIGNGGSAGNLGAATNAAANIVFGATGSTIGKLVYLGTGESTDRLFTINGHATIENSGSGALNFTNTGNIAVAGTTQVLTLGGSYAATANTFQSNIVNGASGSISLVKSGIGTWTLAGTNTYTGTTSVSAGRLDLTGSLTSAITVSSGATLSGTGSTAGNITFNAGSSILASSAGSVQGANVTAAATTNIFVSGAPSGTLQTLDVIRYTGTTPGTANFTAQSNYRSGALTDVTASKKITLAYQAESRTWGGVAGTWDTGTSTTWTTGGSNDQKFYWGDAVTFGAIGADQTITLSGSLAPSSISVSNTANTYTFGGTGALVGPTGITKSGAGTLYINNSGTNTYTGAINVQAGTLQVGTASALGYSTAVNSSGTAVNMAAGTLLRYSNGATAIFTSTGHIITLNDGARVSNQGGANAITVADNFVLNSSTTAAQIGGFTGSTSLYTGTISGVGNLIIDPTLDGGTTSGTFSLGWKTNSYLGNTTIGGSGSAITFQLSTIANGDVYTPFGRTSGTTSGTVTVTTGTTLTFKSPSSPSAYYIANNFNLVASGGSSSILRMNDGVSHITGTVDINQSGAGFVYLQPVYAAKDFYIDGVLSGSGIANVTSNSDVGAKLILTNNSNTFAGTFQLTNAGTSAATLQLDANGAAQYAAVNLSITGSKLYINTGNATIASLTGVTGSDVSAVGSNRTLTVNQSASTAYAGTIGANGISLALVKAGTGTLTLSGASTYTGGTTINAGTLRLDYTNSTASILTSGSALTFTSSGELALLGKATTTSTQTLGAVTLTSGNAILSTSLNSATALSLNVGAFSRSVGGVVQFMGNTGGAVISTTQANAASGVIGTWAVINTGANLADYAVANGSGVNVSAYSGYIGLSTVLAGTTAANTLYSNSGNATMTGALTAYALKQTTTTSTATIALGSNAMTIGGLLISGANSTAGNITITGSGVLGNGAANEFIVNNYSSSILNIQAPIISTTATAGSFTKTGYGTVVINNGGLSLYTGAVTVNQGELQVYLTSPGTATLLAAGTYTPLGTGTINVNTGATLRFKTPSSSTAYTYANAINLSNATLVSEDSVNTFSGAISATGTNTLNVVWNGKNATLSGILSGSGIINVSSTSGTAAAWTSGTSTVTGGPGTLILGNAANTYSGAINLASGTSINAQNVATALGAASTLTINSGASLLWDRSGTSSNLFTNTTTSTVDLKGILWAYQTQSAAYSTVTMNIPNLLLNGGVYIAGGSGGAIVNKQTATLTAVASTTTNLVHAKNGSYNEGMTFSGALSGSGAIVMTRETAGAQNHWMGLTGSTASYTGAISVAATTTTGAYFFSGTNLWGSGTLTATGLGATVVLGDVLYNVNTGWAAQGARTGTFTTAGSLVVGASGQVNLLNQAATDVVSAEIGGSVALNGGTLGLYGTYATPGSFIPLANATWTVGGSAVSTISAPLAFNYSGVTFNVGDSVIGSGIDLLVSGAVQGSKQLTKSGTGTMALTAANTTTGGFNVTAGTLNVGNAGTTGDLGTGAIAIGASGTVVVSRSNDVTIANTFTGSGVISKSASTGIMTLNSNLSGFTGTVAVAAGSAGSTNVLSLGSATSTAAASTITVAQYAALRSNDAVTVGNVTLANGGNLQIIAGTPTTATAFFTAGGTIAFASGAGVVIANTSAISEGTYRLINYSSGALTYNGSTDITGLTATGLAPSRNAFSFSNDTTNKTLDLIVAGVAANLVWNGTLATWDASQSSGVGTAFNNSGNSNVADYFYNYDAVTFDDTGAANTSVTLGAALTPGNITVAGSQNYTFGGTGSLSGVANIVKNGTGTLRLENSGANNLSGTITVNGGKLAVTAAYTMSNGGLILNDGATFANSTAATPKTVGKNLTASGTVTFGDATDIGDLTFSATNTLSAATSITTNVATTFSGATTLGTALTVAGTGSATFSSALALAGNTTLTVESTGGVVLSGIVSGASRGLTKEGSKKLTLTGVNTYNGATNINAGILQLGFGNTNTTAAIAGSINIASGATFIWARSATDLTNTLTGAGTYKYQGNGNQAVSGAAGFSGTWLVMNSDTVATPGYLGFASDAAMGTGSNFSLNGGGFYFTGTGNTMASTRTITLLAGGGFFNGSSSNANTIAATITGAGLLNKVSGETQTFTGANNYSGGTLLKVGTLIAGSNTAFGSGTVTVSDGTSNPFLQFANGITVANAFALGTSSGTASRGMMEAKGTAIGGTSGLVTLNATPTAGAHFATDAGATLKLLGGVTSATVAASFGAGNYIVAGGITATGLTLNATTASISGGIVTTGGITTGAGSFAITDGINAGGNVSIGNGTSSFAGGITTTGLGTITFGAGNYTVTGGITSAGVITLGNGTSSVSGGITTASANVALGTGSYTLSGGGTYPSLSLAGGTLNLGAANGLGKVSAGTAATFTLGSTSAATFNLNGYDQTDAVILAAGASGLTVTNSSATTASLNIANTSTTAFNISGNLALVLSGSGTKGLSGANTYTGGTTVTNGTLSLTSLSALGTGGLTLSGGDFTLNQSTQATLGGALAGSGTFLKQGTGTVTLGTVSGFTGVLNVSVGNVIITGSTLGGSTGASSQIKLSDGTSLSGSFTTGRDITVMSGDGVFTYGGTLRAGTGQTAGTLTTTGTLTFDGGLGGDGVTSLNVLIGNSSADTINVTGGTLNLSGLVNVNFLNGGMGTGTYNILTYNVNASNVLAGSLMIVGDYGHTAITNLVHDTFNGIFSVDVAKASMIWVGDVSGNVDATTANFKLSTTSAPDTLLAGDELIFNDTATTRTVNLDASTPSVAKVTVDTNLGYSIGGAGVIAGTNTQLIKNGSGVLTFAGSHTYGGGTYINNGTLAVATDGALGASTGGITLAAGTTLQATGSFALGSARAVTLAGNANVAVDTSATLSYAGSITGSSSLTKTGNGTLSLSGANVYTGGTNVNAGTLELAGNNALLASGAVNVNGGTLSIGTTTQTVGAVNITSGALSGTGTLSVSSFTAASDSDIAISPIIAGTGATLSKSGSGALTLSSANTFSGGSTLNAGVIRVANASALGTGTITLNSGELSSASTTGYTLTNSVVIGGDISIGDVTNTGALTLSGTVSLGGTSRTLTVDSAVTISGIISNGGLVKNGQGTLALTGANSYTGDTTINAGTLSQSSNTAFGGSITVGSAGTLAFTRSTSGGTLANNISGTGAITFTGTGSGELGLTGSNDFSGSINIVSGKLAFVGANSATGAPTVTIASGATLSLGDGLNGGTAYVTNLSGAGNVNGTWGSTAGTRRLSVNTTSDSTLTGTITDGSAGRVVAVTKTGSATLNLNATNTFTGGLIVNAGTVATTNATGFGSASGAITLSPGSSNAALLIAYGVTAAHNITVSGTGTGTATIGGLTNASSGTNTQYSGVVTLGRDVTLLPGSGDRLTFISKITGTGNITIATPSTSGGRVSWNQSTLAGANDFVGNIIIQDGAQLQIGVGSATNNYAIPDAANIYFEAQTLGTVNNLRISGTGTTSAESVNALISNAVGAGRVAYTDGTSGTLTIGAGNGSGTFSGVILGALSIVKSGTGNQVFSGTNTYTGTTTVTGGTLTLASAGALGGSTLTLNGGAGSVVFDSSVSTFNVGNLAASASGSGYNLVLNNNAETPAGITLSVGGNNGSTTYAGVLSGLGSLTKVGTGSLVLSGLNTYAGDTNVSKGTIALGAGATLGAGNLNVLASAAYGVAYASGGTAFLSVQGTGTSTVANNIVIDSTAGYYAIQKASTTGVAVLSGVISGGGAGAVLQFDSPTGGDSTSTFQLDGANTFVGTMQINRGRIIVNNLSALGNASTVLYLNTNSNTAAGNVVFNLPGTFANPILVGTASNTISTLTNNVTLSGVISGSAAFNKIGTGTLTLSGANNFTGGFTVSEGTVALGAANALPGTSGTLTTSGGTLDLGGYTVTTTGALAANSGSVTNGTITAGSYTSSGNATISATLAGTGTFTKTGAGTTTTLSNSTLSGAVAVNSGTLALAGGNTSLGTVSIASGGVFSVTGGTNTIAGTSAGSGATFNVSGGTLNVVGAIGGMNNAGSSWTIGTGATVNAASVSNTWNPSSFTVNGTLNLSSTTANAFYQSTNGTMAITGTGAVNISGGFINRNYSITTVSVARMNIGGGTAGVGITKENGTLILGSATTATTIGVFGQNWSSSVAMSIGTAGVTFDTQDSVDGTTGRTISLSGVLSNHTSNTGMLTKTGNGTLTLSGNNTFSGALIVNGGTLNLNGTHQSVASIAANNGSTINFNTTNFLVGGHLTAVADSRTISATGGSSLVFSSGKDARLGNINLADSTFTSNQGLTGYDVLLANVTSGAATVTVTGSSASTMNGTGGLHLSGVQNFNVADATSSSAADLVVSLQLSDGGTIGGTGGINKTGAGTMSLTNANNNFTGNITVGAGTLEVGGAGRLNAGSYAGTITNNGTLNISTSANQSLTGVVSGTGSLTKSGNGTLTLSNANTYTGDTAVNGGTLKLTRADALSASSALTIGSAGTFRLDYALTSDTTIARTFSGSGIIDLATTGYTTALSGLSGFTGSVKLSTGTVFDAATSSWTGNLLFAGGTLLGGLSSYTGEVTVSNGGSLSVADGLPTNLVLSTGGTLDFTGVTNSNITIQFAGGTLANASGFKGNVNVVGTGITVGANSLGGGTLVLGAGSSVNVTGTIGNAVTVTGGSIQGGNNVTGAITVSSGSFTIGAPSGTVGIDTLNTNASLNVGGGALNLNNGAVGNTINFTSGSITNGANFTGTINVNAGNLNNTGTLGGSVFVNDTGTLKNNGTLTGDVSVQDGGTLTGSGTFDGYVTVASGGTLSPGNSPGIQTYNGTLALEGGSTWAIQVYSEQAVISPGVRGYDTIVINGDPISGAVLDLTDASSTNKIILQLMTLTHWADSSGGIPAAGNLTYARDVAGEWIPKDFVLATYTGNALTSLAVGEEITSLFAFDTTGYFFATGPRARSADFTIFEYHNDVSNLTELTLRVVPEPSTYGIILGGLALAAAAIRRRRQMKA